MDRNGMENSTYIVKYIAVSSCLSCLSATSHPVVPKVSRIWCMPLSLLVQLTTPAALPHLKQTMRMCLQVWKLGFVKKSSFPGIHNLKSHSLSGACFEQEEHCWCQSSVYHKLTHCLNSFLLFASFSKHPALASSRVRILDKKEAERWIPIKHGLTMAVLKCTLMTTASWAQGLIC